MSRLNQQKYLQEEDFLYKWIEEDEGAMRALFLRDSNKVYLFAMLMAIDYSGARYSVLAVRSSTPVKKLSFYFKTLNHHDQAPIPEPVIKLVEMAFQQSAINLQTETEISDQVLKLFHRFEQKINDTLHKKFVEYNQALHEKFPIDVDVIKFVGGASFVWTVQKITNDIQINYHGVGYGSPHFLVFYKKFLIALSLKYSDSQGHDQFAVARLSSYNILCVDFRCPMGLQIESEEQLKLRDSCLQIFLRAETLSEKQGLLLKSNLSPDKLAEFLSLANSKAFSLFMENNISHYQINEKELVAEAIEALKVFNLGENLLQNIRTAMSGLEELIKKYSSNQPQALRQIDQLTEALSSRVENCRALFESQEKKLLNQDQKKILFELKKRFILLDKQEGKLRSSLLLLSEKIDSVSRKSRALSEQSKRPSATACTDNLTEANVVVKKAPLVASALVSAVVKKRPVELVAEKNNRSDQSKSTVTEPLLPERVAQSVESKNQAHLKEKIRELEKNVSSLNMLVQRKTADAENAMQKKALAEENAKEKMKDADIRSARLLNEKEIEIMTLRADAEKAKEQLCFAETAQIIRQEESHALKSELQKLQAKFLSQVKAQVEIAAAAARMENLLEEKDAVISALREEIAQTKKTIVLSRSAEKTAQEQCDAVKTELQKIKLAAEEQSKKHAEKEEIAGVEKQHLRDEITNLQAALRNAISHQNEIRAHAVSKLQVEIARVVTSFQQELNRKNTDVHLLQSQLRQIKHACYSLEQEKNNILARFQTVNSSHSFSADMPAPLNNQMMPSPSAAGFFGGTPVTMGNNQSLRRQPSALVVAFLGFPTNS